MSGAAFPDRLAGRLRRGVPAIVLSVGTDGWAHAAMTWAVARSSNTVRFIVDCGSTTLANLRRNGKASLQVVAGDDVLALLKGPARECRARVEAAPFAMAMWEMSVEQVKDQAWAPVAVSPLAYDWRGPDAQRLREIENAVLTELRESP